MLGFFNNHRLTLAFTANHIFLSFVIISSLITFIATQPYFDNIIVAQINIINSIFSSIAVATYLQEKLKHQVKRLSILWFGILTIKLIMIPFVMLMSKYSLVLLANFSFSILFCMLLIKRRSFFVALIIGIIAGIIYLKLIQLYTSIYTIENYALSLKDSVFILLSCIITLLGILILIYYKQIELEIKIDNMRVFNNVIAYEIFTPLAVIETMLGCLQHNNNDDQIQIIRDLIKKCQSTRQNINLLIQNIKTIRNVQSFGKKQHSLKMIVEETLKDFYANFELQPTINFNFHNDITFLGCNKMIKCMIVNILRNTLQHAGLNTQIDILISGNHLILQDNGSGIKEAMMSSIFDLFTSSSNHNFGIGLSICKDIIINHGGDINCISLEGSHTTIIITFPSV